MSANKTSIEWCTHSLNPIRLGKGHYCEKISPGCKLCYASRLQFRFGNPEFQDQRGDTSSVYLNEGTLREPLRMRKPARIFWNDMSDLFGDWVPDDWIDRHFAVMALTPQHTHLVLTKRAKRMREYFAGDCLKSRIVAFQWGILEDRVDPLDRRSDDIRATALDPDQHWPLPNVHLGVSVENQKYANARMIDLALTPATRRFISYEPALERVDFCLEAFRGLIHQIIIGGESGPGARPFHVDWARDTIRQCREEDVAPFVKQLGALPIDPKVTCRIECGCGLHYGFRNRKGGDPSEWPEDLRVREYPA